MATATVRLTLDNADFMARMAASQAKLAEFSATMRGLVLGAAGAIGAIVGISAAADVLGKSINEAANMEKLQVAFTTLIGNTKVAKQTLKDLQEFADTTTFTMNDVAPAAKQLLAYGFAAKDLTATLRMLGDVASAQDIPLGELTNAFGRNMAAGRLYTKDLNEFQGRGIPVVAALAKNANVAEAEIRKMVEAGTIGSAELLAAFKTMTGPGSQFGGMLAEQGKTFSGMMGTLKDRFDAAFREFGKPLIDSLKPVIEWISSNMGAIVAKAKEWGEGLATGMRIAFNVMKEGRLGEVISLSLEAGAQKGFDAFLRHGEAAFKTVWVMLGAIGQGFTAANGPFSYLGEAEFWLGVASLASAAMLKVGNTLANSINDASGDLFGKLSDQTQADFAQIAEVASGNAPTEHKVLEAQFKADRLRKKDSNSAELDKVIADAAASQKAYIQRAAAAAPEILTLASDAYADALKGAQGSPEVRKRGEDAMAKLDEIFKAMNKAGQAAEAKFTPAEKTGEAFAGKDFSASTAAASAGKFDVIASSLAKVGGGGLFAAAGPNDPLITATKNATSATERNTAAVAENNKLLSLGRYGSSMSLRH